MKRVGTVNMGGGYAAHVMFKMIEFVFPSNKKKNPTDEKRLVFAQKKNSNQSRMI